LIVHEHSNFFNTVEKQRWSFVSERLLVVLAPGHGSERYAHCMRGSRIPNLVANIKRLFWPNCTDAESATEFCRFPENRGAAEPMGYQFDIGGSQDALDIGG
jgi:hypothetical protein